jgi:hypothetical protein
MQPFLSCSVEKRGDQSRFASLGLCINLARSRYLTEADPERKPSSKWELPGPRHGGLVLGRPGTGEASLVYDPADPFGTYGGNNLFVTPCGPQVRTRRFCCAILSIVKTIILPRQARDKHGESAQKRSGLWRPCGPQDQVRAFSKHTNKTQLHNGLLLALRTS